MICREVEELLHAYCDGELDLIRHVQVEEHLPQCPGCAKQEQELRMLRSAVSTAAPYHRAPASLRAKIQESLHRVTLRASTPRQMSNVVCSKHQQMKLSSALDHWSFKSRNANKTF